MANSYIKGLDQENLTITSKNKMTGVIRGISVAPEGHLQYGDKRLLFQTELMVTLSDDLVSLGYPHTMFMEKGSVMEARPAAWALLDDESRKEFIEQLQGETFSIKVRQYRNITI
jgi:hypothetical protein